MMRQSASGRLGDLFSPHWPAIISTWPLNEIDVERRDWPGWLHAHRKEALAMNLEKSIKVLRKEKKIIDSAIAVLQTMLSKGPGVTTPKPVRKRGRKGMPRAERLEVSRRMKAYWEKRRAQAGKEA